MAEANELPPVPSPRICPTGESPSQISTSSEFSSAMTPLSISDIWLNVKDFSSKQPAALNTLTDTLSLFDNALVKFENVAPDCSVPLTYHL